MLAMRRESDRPYGSSGSTGNSGNLVPSINSNYATYPSDSCLANSTGPTGAGLDEYVDILQVQQLLLDSTPSTGNPTSTSSTSSNSSKSRPRVNLQKATEYSSQAQAESPSRRVLLDYPSPYLYGNYHHTSPSEDLVALWFGGNGSGCAFGTRDRVQMITISSPPHLSIAADPVTLAGRERTSTRIINTCIDSCYIAHHCILCVRLLFSHRDDHTTSVNSRATIWRPHDNKMSTSSVGRSS
ncbi:flocculation protein FLO11-like [Sergentomyia squamirostris]